MDIKKQIDFLIEKDNGNGLSPEDVVLKTRLMRKLIRYDKFINQEFVEISIETIIKGIYVQIEGYQKAKDLLELDNESSESDILDFEKKMTDSDVRKQCR